MLLQLTPMVFTQDVEERNPEDYLISKWDFEGSDLETQLADKAEKGSTSDPVELVGEGIVIENGVMKIPTTAKTYARVKCPEGSGQYSMANKTVIFRAKFSEVTEGSTLVAGIFGKAGLWNVYFANAKIGRALSLHYFYGSGIGTNKAWPSILAKKYNMDYLNNGVGGSTVGVYDGYPENKVPMV